MDTMSIQLKDFELFMVNGKGERGSYPALFCAKGESNDPAQVFQSRFDISILGSHGKNVRKRNASLRGWRDHRRT